MSVAFDNTASVTGDSVTSLTTPAFTIGGANRAGFLGISFQGNAATGITSSLGGVSGALIAGTDNGTDTNRRTLMHGVTNPPTGSQTGTMSWTTAANAVLGVVTASGVDQATSFDNGTKTFGTADPANLTVTSVSGDLTSSVICNDGTAAITTNQTERWSLTAGAAIRGAGDTGPGTGTTTHTWSGVATAPPGWGVSGANFRAAAGALIRTQFQFRVPEAMVFA